MFNKDYSIVNLGANIAENTTVDAPKWKAMWDKFGEENPQSVTKFKVPLPTEVVKDNNFKENFGLLIKRRFVSYLHLSAMVNLPDCVQV